MLVLSSCNFVVLYYLDLKSSEDCLSLCAQMYMLGLCKKEGQLLSNSVPSSNTVLNTAPFALQALKHLRPLTVRSCFIGIIRHLTTAVSRTVSWTDWDPSSVKKCEVDKLEKCQNGSRFTTNNLCPSKWNTYLNKFYGKFKL